MPKADSGIVKVKSMHSVDRTVQKLEGALKTKGITLFTVIDHSGEAQRVGLHMPDTKLLIFGDPRAGTPIMLASPSAAIDLPLKILVSEDSDGNVWISYNSTSYLGDRHGIPQDLLRGISGVEALAMVARE